MRIAGDVYPLMLTLGAGNRVREFGTESGVFAGAGIGLTEHFGTSVAYNGGNVDVGASFRLPGLESVGFNVILSVNWIARNVF
ncbi:hypothetical protein [Aliiruegeria lutimaris]|uniref:Outer membrane protein beta-barrel domain-containing protein n=1 Tax=Aliiruegeria lutimaris TaxID=571298 RepID=A0A1G8K7V0_9RHOB|nr:hypothetical protein [Aliiruegeria lutimaris]SDI39504.1 hypothetical protein SAMN04488026_1002171 [Aliiruegeria lutimaris]